MDSTESVSRDYHLRVLLVARNRLRLRGSAWRIILMWVDSMLDGTPTLRLNEFMLASVAQGKIPLELPENERYKSSMPKPEEIVFELDAKTTDAIEKSKNGFGEEMSLQELKVSYSARHVVQPRVELTGYRRWSISPGTVRTPSKPTNHPPTLGFK